MRACVRCACVVWLAILCGVAHAQFIGFPGTTVRFASVEQGNLLSWDEQRRKLELVAETARKAWG